MKSILPRILILTIFASTGLLMHAQDRTPVAPIEYLRPMKNSFSIGVRMIGGANVTFSGALGRTTSYTAQQWFDVYGYNDGTHLVDSGTDTANGSRPLQDSANSVSWNLVPGGVEGRFYTILLDSNGAPAVVDGNSVVTGDYVAYNSSYTRNWSYAGASQLQSSANDGVYDQVAMSAYSSLGTDGGTATAKDSRNPGIELVMGRVIQRFKRFEWGVTVGFGMSEFNAKTRQNLPVRFEYIRDIYNIYTTGTNFDQQPTQGGVEGLTVTGTNPSFNTAGTGAGALTYPSPTDDDPDNEAIGTRETTNPISKDPVGERQTGTDAVGSVDGYWQVKGVYYMLRVGPMARIPIGKRFSAYVSAGYMAAYVGSKFRYDETVNLPGGDTGTISTAVRDANGNVIDTKDNQRYMSGFYADLNFEWWLSTRTGFYAGMAYERLGTFTQNFNDRKATVKMDNGLGLRFGIITRF